MTLVDANVLIDLFTEDPSWFSWSLDALTRSISDGITGINPIIYAEASVSYLAECDFASALDTLNLVWWELPYGAAFLAGKAFVSYRRNGGERRSPLPDFYIGAHAQASGLRVLTRDPTRYRTYFPDVNLICP